ncbi:terpene synthase family protein, partial [Micromonospora zhanjiangensis]
APVVARLLEVLDLSGAGTVPPPVAGGPLGVALHDLCRRVRRQNHPPSLLRFVGDLREYLLALLWEAANREHHRVPAVAEYIRMRRHTGAVHPSFTLTDLAHGALPGAELLADPALSRMDRLAADLVCWCNDVFSYDKERRLGEDGHNLAVTIALETGQDEEAALTDAANRFNAGLDTYLGLERELLTDAAPAVRRFADARRCWIRGTYDWSLRASRYY